MRLRYFDDVHGQIQFMTAHPQLKKKKKKKKKLFNRYIYIYKKKKKKIDKMQS
jgi:hypothetical protein